MSAIKRMHSDMRDYFRSKSLNEQGIFCSFDEEDALHVRAMIVGPEDTPYFGGYYFFDMRFPQEYPHKPPKVSYETRWQDIRFHPNLYANAKVCLSILGTWSGPGWTSAQTLSSVLLTIQSLLMKDPLTNEPGYEVRKAYTEQKHKLYETLITYENFRTAIFRMLETPPLGFEAFLPIMQQCFLENAQNIYANMKQHAELESTVSTIRCGVYNFKRVIDYKECLALMQQTMHSCGISYDQDDTPTPHTPPTTNEVHTTENNEINQDEMTNEDSIIVNTIHNLSVNEHPTANEHSNTQKTVQQKMKIKRPPIGAKLCQGQMKTVIQPNGSSLVFQSRKCKQLDTTKPEKWQWRKVNT